MKLNGTFGMERSKSIIARVEPEVETKLRRTIRFKADEVMPG